MKNYLKIFLIYLPKLHLNGILFTDKVTDKKSLVTYDNFIKFYEKEYIKSVSESFIA